MSTRLEDYYYGFKWNEQEIATDPEETDRDSKMEMKKSQLLCFGYCRLACSILIDPIVDIIILFMVLYDKFTLISADLVVSNDKQYIKYPNKKQYPKYAKSSYRSAFGNLLINVGNAKDERTITWLSTFKIPAGNNREEIYIGFTNFTHHIKDYPSNIESKKGEIWVGFGMNFVKKFKVTSIDRIFEKYPFGNEWCWEVGFDQYYNEGNFPQVNGEICMVIYLDKGDCCARIKVKYNTSRDKTYKTVTAYSDAEWGNEYENYAEMTNLKKGFLSVTLSRGCEFELKGIEMCKEIDYEKRDCNNFI